MRDDDVGGNALFLRFSLSIYSFGEDSENCAWKAGYALVFVAEGPCIKLFVKIRFGIMLAAPEFCGYESNDPAI